MSVFSFDRVADHAFDLDAVDFFGDYAYAAVFHGAFQ